MGGAFYLGLKLGAISKKQLIINHNIQNSFQENLKVCSISINKLGMSLRIDKII